MEEPKIENFEVEAKTIGTDDGSVVGQVSTQQQAPVQAQSVDPRIQTGGGVTMQVGAPAGAGSKKIMIIAGAAAAVLIVGGIAFFIWKSGSEPTPEQAPAAVEQASAPIALPPLATTTETAAAPSVPQQDDISVIEQDLNAFNVGGIDAEVQGNLSEVSKSL
jgi:uncharacterized membrane protein YebE (DUF533 family)